MLVLTVVVHEDARGADVGVLADRRVAHVREVGDLGALADRRVLHLDVRTGLGLGAEVRAGAQVREGTHGRLRAHDRALGDRVVHPGARAHVGVLESGVGADLGALGDVRGAQQLGAGVHDRVLPEGDSHVDEGAGRVDDRDAREHGLLQQARVQQCAGLGELDAVVDPEDLPVVAADGRADAVPGLAQDAEDVGEVLLALAVVGTDLAEGVGEQGAVEGEDARVDLADRALGVGGVLVLDDGRHGAAGVADDASVAGGVGDLGGQHGDGVAVGLVRPREPGQGLAGQQRGVAADDDHGAGDAAAELFEGHADGVPGAVLLVLDGGADVGVDAGQVRGDLLPGVPDDHDEVLGVQLTGGGDDVTDERAPADLVENLGSRRLHAGAFTRCEYDDGCRAVGAHGDALRLRGWTREGYRGAGAPERTRVPTVKVRTRNRAAPPPGLEPGHKAPKASVLPITPQGIVNVA